MSKNLTLAIQGGLGNQLLQLALAHRLADTLSVKLTVNTSLLDCRFRSMRGVSKRHLCNFASYRSSSSAASIYPARLAHRIGLGANLFDGALRCLSFPKKKILLGNGLSQHAFDASCNVFWLDFLNFLQNAYRNDLPVQPNTVIHIRLGDFLSKKVQNKSSLYPLGGDYYKRAYCYLSSSVGELQTPILVSDDISRASQMLSECGVPFQALQSSSPEFDLFVISQSSNLISANSTFSAIGAHLSRLSSQNASTVVAPTKWFLDEKMDYSRFDLRSPSWILL